MFVGVVVAEMDACGCVKEQSKFMSRLKNAENVFVAKFTSKEKSVSQRGVDNVFTGTISRTIKGCEGLQKKFDVPDGTADIKKASPKCDPKVSKDLLSNDSTKRVAAMRACLEAHAVKIEQESDISSYLGKVTRLYTHGDPNKHKSLSTMTGDQAEEFQTALIHRREQRHLATKFKRYMSEKDKFEKEALEVYRKYYSYGDMMRAWNKLPDKQAKDKRVQNVWKAASLEKMYPGYHQ
jgi:hypothetical protein